MEENLMTLEQVEAAAAAEPKNIGLQDLLEQMRKLEQKRVWEKTFTMMREKLFCQDCRKPIEKGDLCERCAQRRAREAAAAQEMGVWKVLAEKLGDGWEVNSLGLRREKPGTLQIIRYYNGSRHFTSRMSESYFEVSCGMEQKKVKAGFTADERVVKSLGKMVAKLEAEMAEKDRTAREFEQRVTAHHNVILRDLERAGLKPEGHIENAVRGVRTGFRTSRYEAVPNRYCFSLKSQDGHYITIEAYVKDDLTVSYLVVTTLRFESSMELKKRMVD